MNFGRKGMYLYSTDTRTRFGGVELLSGNVTHVLISLTSCIEVEAKALTFDSAPRAGAPLRVTDFYY